MGGPRSKRGLIKINPCHPLALTPFPRYHRGESRDGGKAASEGLGFMVSKMTRKTAESPGTPENLSLHWKTPLHQSIRSRRPLVKC